MNNIEEIKNTFLPKCRDVKFTQIDLDISDLGVADILRNINKLFPKHSRAHQQILNGDLSLIIKCVSEYLSPMDGLVLIITNDNKTLNITARNHIVAVISVDKISDDEEVKNIMKDFLSYILKEYRNSLDDLNAFCVKYIYDIDMETDEI